MQTLYLNNDNLVEFDMMTQSSDGSFVNDATVTFTLATSFTTAVPPVAAGAVANHSGVSMPYIAGSDGKYQGVIDSTAALTVGTTYYVGITYTSGTKNGFTKLTCQVVNRTN